MPLIGRENFKKLTDKGLERVNKDLRGVYLSGLYNVVVGTPVDEGRTRNNWFLTMGAPSSKTTTSKSKGLGAIRSIRQMPNYVLNKKMYFSNNYPSVVPLEYGGFPNPVKLGSWDKKKKTYVKKSEGGFSKQAPKGWVRATLIAMQSKIRSL
jgi:hypothetical protein